MWDRRGVRQSPRRRAGAERGSHHCLDEGATSQRTLHSTQGMSREDGGGGGRQRSDTHWSRWVEREPP